MMNCAECNELLAAYFEGLLKDSDEQIIEEHLKHCEACQVELKELQTLRQRLVAAGRAMAESDCEEQVMNRIIREQNARLKSAARARVGLAIRRLIMKSSVVKVAVAAAVVLVALGAWSLWSGTDAGVALADVLVKVEQIQAFMYKMTMHMKGETQGVSIDTNMDASILIAEEYGMKMDMSSSHGGLGVVVNQQMYMLPRQKMIMMLMPAMKKYMRMEVNAEMFEEKRQEGNDPRIMLKKILECQYTDLGKTVLDGVEVQGFQTTDPAYSGGLGDVDVRVWVDLKTELPVRVDMKIKMTEQMEMEATLHDFQWDVAASAADFEPVIPADFTAGPGDGMRLPAMTEETAIEGLRLYASLRNEYPKDLNLMTLIQASAETLQGDPNSAFDPSQRREDMIQAIEEQTKKAMDKMMPIQMLGGFYATLVQEQKEPAYYGKVVPPGDKALVLLRWKTGENEYRVLFGDLHAETITGETLATLEAALPK